MPHFVLLCGREAWHISATLRLSAGTIMSSSLPGRRSLSGLCCHQTGFPTRFRIGCMFALPTHRSTWWDCGYLSRAAAKTVLTGIGSSQPSSDFSRRPL